MQTAVAPRYVVDENGKVAIGYGNDGSPYTAAVMVGGFEMMREIGLPITDHLFKEPELGVTLAQTMPRDQFSRVMVACTSLGHEIDERVDEELATLHDFNLPYTHLSRTIGNRYTMHRLPPASRGQSCDVLNQETGVTVDYLRRRLNAGEFIYPDRNDTRLARALDDSSLMRGTHLANDKNNFLDMLLSAGTPWTLPATVVIREMELRWINELQCYGDDKIIGHFTEMLRCGGIPHGSHFDPAIPYFIKVSGGAGGNSAEASMCRMERTVEQGTQFRQLLNNLKRRHREGVRSRGLQLVAPITNEKGPHGNPLLVNGTPLFSPCLTLRISSHGLFVLGQAAEQVLSDGDSYGGSYWHKEKENHFLAQIKGGIPALAQALSHEGYRGYFGTDFVRAPDSTYSLAIDGNARINGNDLIYFTRRPLERNGVPVLDAYMCFPAYAAEDGRVALELGETFGAFTFNPETTSGLVLFPHFKAKTLRGEDTAREAVGIYVNPSLDEARFNEFFSLVGNSNH